MWGLLGSREDLGFGWGKELGEGFNQRSDAVDLHWKRITLAACEQLEDSREE